MNKSKSGLGTAAEIARREESLWACFSCGRAQRMTHNWDAQHDTVVALAKHQHDSRQRGQQRCYFDTANVRITRHVEGTKLVGFEVPAK